MGIISFVLLEKSLISAKNPVTLTHLSQKGRQNLCSKRKIEHDNYFHPTFLILAMPLPSSKKQKGKIQDKSTRGIMLFQWSLQR
jgi:hypothetical protein